MNLENNNMNDNTPQLSDKKFKNIIIKPFYVSYIVMGIWGVILIGIMLNKIKSVSYTDNCIKYNFYNQCIEYK